MDSGRRWIAAGDGSHPEIDRGRIWIATGYRWMTGDGSQEMDHRRRMTVNLLAFHEDIEATRSYTRLEVTLISSYEVIIECRYADIRCTGGMAPPCMIPSNIPSTIPSSTQITIQ
jgi:hypothetical protein